MEPIIFYEFAHACSKLAWERQLKNVFVSNGYMTPEVSPPLVPILGGINLGTKAFTCDFYKKGVQLQVTADAGYTIQLMSDLGIWVEITTLLIPGLNDSAEELRDIPWHV